MTGFPLRLRGMVLTICMACAGMAAAGEFPEFGKLSAPVLVRENPELGVAPDGAFTLDGKPRYLVGMIYYDFMQAGYAPTPGYPETLRWLYDRPLDYQSAQRVGFDSVGLHASDAWIKPILPGYRSPFWVEREETAIRQTMLGAKLPIYFDFTCFPWTHGKIPCGEDGCPVGDEARNHLTANRDNNHWMPYNLGSKAGRDLYLAMLRSGAQFAMDAGFAPFVYELFNEPDYNDWNPVNRDLFVERLKKRYASLAELNQSWGTAYGVFEEIGRFTRQSENPALHVEWNKFMEDLFVEVCAEGIQAIREVDPNPQAGFCVQPLKMKMTNINAYRLSKIMNMICSPTGGGGFLQAHFLRATADGKPFFDGETYLGKTFQSVRHALWRQYARGFNASYIFKWDKRAWDNAWGGADKTAEGGQKLAEIFPYLLLNPYAVPTDALTGIMAAKQEILAVDDLFTPRDRGVERPVAVLRSYPTERLAQAVGTTSHNFIADYAAALEYGHIPLDVIMEEQLPEGRQSRYKVIVAAGVDAVYEKTPAYLEEFVTNGGTLVLGMEAMQLNEYGQLRKSNAFPGIVPGKELSPEIGQFQDQTAALAFDAAPYRQAELGTGWQVRATLDGKPAVAVRATGKGKVVFVNARMANEKLMALLGVLLGEDSVFPVCQTTVEGESGTAEAAYEIEVIKAVRDNTVGYVLMNQSLAPKVVRFAAPEAQDSRFVLCNPFDKQILPAEKGEVALFLLPSDRLVLVGSTSEILTARFGEMETVAFDKQLADAKDRLSAAGQAEEKETKAFRVKPDKVKLLDLKPFANRGFVDRIAGDGQGGWTDQGENSLHGAPWGVVDCQGVPFDFIRFDHNEDRTCIVLQSEHMKEVADAVRGIPVQTRAEALYFLHTSAWTDGSEALRYVVHYADGTAHEIPIRGNIEIGDWWSVRNSVPGRRAVPGWSNIKHRGFYVYEWKNPQPEKNIATLDIVSAKGAIIPIVVAVTAVLPGGMMPTEEEEAGTPLIGSADSVEVKAWGGLQATVEQTPAGAVATLTLTDKAQEWCGATLALSAPFDLPSREGMLSFYINSAQNRWGAHQGKVALQMKLPCTDNAGEKTGGDMIPIQEYLRSGVLDSDPESWQPVRIPLKRLVNEHARFVTSIQLQIIGQPPTQAGGIELRGFAVSGGKP